MKSGRSLSHSNFQAERLDLFWWFLCERQRIWCRRFIDQDPPPWTEDPVLQQERFTNVYRELDPGTQYALGEILEQEAPKPDKIFNIMLYRLIGRAETHRQLGFQYLSSFSSSHLESTLKNIQAAGGTPYTAAYMVSAYRSMGSTNKAENIARLFAQIQKNFDDVYQRIERATTAVQVHTILSDVYGFGNFLAYQVLVDLLYPLRIYNRKPLLPHSHDEWASPGPGAKRGISMLLDDDFNPTGLEVMRWLRDNQEEEFSRLGLGFPYLRDDLGTLMRLSLANIQNCLCEYHKYVKIREGRGRGRRKFRPTHTDHDAIQLPLSVGSTRLHDDQS